VRRVKKARKEGLGAEMSLVRKKFSFMSVSQKLYIWTSGLLNGASASSSLL